MAFDIRSIFDRALGGTQYRMASADGAYVEDEQDSAPESPIEAASRVAQSDDQHYATNGATAATAMMPGGLAASPTAAVDEASASEDDAVYEDQAMSVALVAVATAVVNGPVSLEGAVELLDALHEVSGLESLTAAQLRELFRAFPRVRSRADRETFFDVVEDRLQEIASVMTDPELRRAAFQLAVYIALWDGPISEAADFLLDMIADEFEISRDEATRLRRQTYRETREQMPMHRMA